MAALYSPLRAAHRGEALQHFIALRILRRGLVNRLAGLLIQIETSLVIVVHIAGHCRGEQSLNAGPGILGGAAAAAADCRTKKAKTRMLVM